MNVATIVIGILLIVFSVFLIVAVLMQQGKNHNLSGTIAGGAETFFGKSKGQSLNKKLSILTSAVAIVFVVLVLAQYVVQTKNEPLTWGAIFGDADEVLTEAPETEAVPADTTAAVDTTAAPVDETTAG